MDSGPLLRPNGWVRWVVWGLIVDEVLGILAFTSYVPSLIPTSTGLAVQDVLWVLAYPLVPLTNMLSPLFSLLSAQRH